MIFNGKERDSMNSHKKLSLLIMTFMVGQQSYASNDQNREYENDYSADKHSWSNASSYPKRGEKQSYADKDYKRAPAAAGGMRRGYQNENLGNNNLASGYNFGYQQNQHPSRLQTLPMNRAILSDADIQADKLIELSYFSPEMQQAVLTSVNKPFKVNVVTGKVQDIPTVAQIIASAPVENTTKLNGLHAALEATRTAIFLAGLNVAYDNPNYVFFAPNISSNLFMPAIDPELKKSLNERETDILMALQQIPEYHSWWSWIPDDLVSMFTLTGKKLQADVAQLLDSMVNPLNFNPDVGNLDSPGNLVTISGNTLQELIKHFNYKQKVNPQQAANLLFKQCFIAQQIFDNDPVQQFFPADAWPLYPIPAGQTVSSANYIFDRFEVVRQVNIYPNKHDANDYNQFHHAAINATYAHTIDELCNAISQNAAILPHNTLQAHLLFLRIRKAIQTAIFIANKNSNYYLGYVLPVNIIKYLDSVVHQLVKYDEKLSALCKNQQLGATVDDLKRDKIWNAITVTASAAVALGVTATVIDYGAGAGASANMIAQGTETGAYYAGKGAVNAGYYAVAVPVQVGKGVVTGIGSVATGVAKGSYNAAIETADGIKNYISPSVTAPVAQTPSQIIVPTQEQSKTPAQ